MRPLLLAVAACLAACDAMNAPTAPAPPAAPLPYSLAVRDSLAYLNAHAIAYRSSEVIGRCLNPDTLAWFPYVARHDFTRVSIVSWKACP